VTTSRDRISDAVPPVPSRSITATRRDQPAPATVPAAGCVRSGLMAGRSARLPAARRDLVVLLIATFLSWMGQRMTAIALPLVALASTGSAWTTGLVAGAAGLPLVTSAWWAGRLRHRIASGPALAVTLAAQTLGLLVVPVSALVGAVTAVQLGICGLLSGAAAALAGPARQALTADIADRLGPGAAARALAWQDLAHRTSMVLAPPLAAAAVASAGALPLLWCEAAGIAVAAILSFTVRPAATSANEPSPPLMQGGESVVRGDAPVVQRASTAAQQSAPGEASVPLVASGGSGLAGASVPVAVSGGSGSGGACVPVAVSDGSGLAGGSVLVVASGGSGAGRASVPATSGSDPGGVDAGAVHPGSAPPVRIRAVLRRHRELRLAFLMSGAGGALWFAFTLGLAVLGAETGRPGVLIAAGFTGYGVGSIAGALAAPRLATRLPALPTAATGWILLGLVFVAMAAATGSPALIAVLAAVGGVAMPIGIAAVNALITDRTSGPERRAAFAAESIIHDGLATLGMLVGGAVIGLVGARSAFVGAGVLQAAVALTVLIVHRSGRPVR
jgi:MFS family permease